MNSSPTTEDHIASNAKAASRAVVEMYWGRITMGQN